MGELTPDSITVVLALLTAASALLGWVLRRRAKPRPPAIVIPPSAPPTPEAVEAAAAEIEAEAIAGEVERVTEIKNDVEVASESAEASAAYALEVARRLRGEE